MGVIPNWDITVYSCWPICVSNICLRVESVSSCGSGFDSVSINSLAFSKLCFPISTFNHLPENQNELTSVFVGFSRFFVFGFFKYR